MPFRCRTCQAYGHKENRCPTKKVACPRCAGGHRFEDCTNRDSPHCVNCGGSHSAAYRKCRVYEEVQSALKVVAISKKSFRDALISVRVNADSITTTTASSTTTGTTGCVTTNTDATNDVNDVRAEASTSTNTNSTLTQTNITANTQTASSTQPAPSTAQAPNTTHRALNNSSQNKKKNRAQNKNRNTAANNTTTVSENSQQNISISAAAQQSNMTKESRQSHNTASSQTDTEEGSVWAPPPAALPAGDRSITIQTFVSFFVKFIDLIKSTDDKSALTTATVKLAMETFSITADVIASMHSAK